MPGRVGVDKAVVGVGLVLESGGAGGQHTRSGCLQVVHEELEVHLHVHLAIRPGGWPVVVDSLEADVTVRPFHDPPVLVTLCDPAGDLGIEPRERDRVGGVDCRPAEPDQVRHQPIAICWYVGVSSSHRSCQPGAPASGLQPSGWTGPPTSSDRPRSSRWARQPEAWNGRCVIGSPRSSTTNRVLAPSRLSHASIWHSSSVPGSVVRSRWWGASHASMRAGPVQLLVNTVWIVPPTRKSPSTLAIQRTSRSGVVHACQRSSMSVSYRSSTRTAPRVSSSLRIVAILVIVVPSFLVRSRCGGRRAGSPRAGGTLPATRRPRRELPGGVCRSGAARPGVPRPARRPAARADAGTHPGERSAEPRPV